MGRRGLKINISGIKMHHFFVPELMVATVLVKTIVFDQLLNFLFFDFFRFLGGGVSQVFGVKSNGGKAAKTCFELKSETLLD